MKIVIIKLCEKERGFAYHGACVEVRRQHLGVNSLLPLHESGGVSLSPDLHKCCLPASVSSGLKIPNYLILKIPLFIISL